MAATREGRQIRDAELIGEPQGWWRVLLCAVALLLGGIVALVLALVGIGTLVDRACGPSDACGLALMLFFVLVGPALLSVVALRWLHLSAATWLALVGWSLWAGVVLFNADGFWPLGLVVLVPVAAGWTTDPRVGSRGTRTLLAAVVAVGGAGILAATAFG